MFQRSMIGVSVVILTLGVATVTAKGNQETAATTEEDIVYNKAGSTELKLDLMRPKAGEGEGLFPAIVVIHGGAWRQGSKADVRAILAMFVRHGYVAVAPQYRFAPKDAFPAQVHDVKASVRWIKANAKKYRIDPERIGAIGFSAGGHLAMMLGMTGPSDGLEGDVSAGAPDSRIKAVVNYFGPTDLAAKDIPDICKPWVKDLLGGTPEEKPEAAAKASPLTFVSKDDAPVLTFQGTKDPLVPFNQAIKLADAMTAANLPGRVELLIGAQHGWGGAELDQTINEGFRFFDRYLKPKPAPSKKP
jgi:acetyl esterase/lipase